MYRRQISKQQHRWGAGVRCGVGLCGAVWGAGFLAVRLAEGVESVQRRRLGSSRVEVRVRQGVGCWVLCTSAPPAHAPCLPPWCSNMTIEGTNERRYFEVPTGWRTCCLNPARCWHWPGGEGGGEESTKLYLDAPCLPRRVPRRGARKTGASCLACATVSQQLPACTACRGAAATHFGRGWGGCSRRVLSHSPPDSLTGHSLL